MFLGLALYFNAWFELDTERRTKDGLDGISRSAVFQYAEDYGLSVEQYEDLWYYVRAMDEAHLKRQREKNPPPKPTPKRKRG